MIKARSAVALQVLLFFLPVLATAQALRIDLSWNGDDFDGFEGGLVLPHQRGAAEEVLRSILPGSSKDGSIKVSPSLIGGSASWTANALKPGRYQLFVSDQASLQDMSKPSSLARAGLNVTVRTQAGSASFEPPEKSGAIWHVCDILGEDGSIVSDNSILPWKTLVFGYARDAVTGKPIEGASITLKAKVDGTEKRTATNAEGKYIALADFGAWTISIAKDGYIGWKEDVSFIEAEYPIRADAYLSPPLADKQYRFVLSWGASPPDLDAHVIGPSPSGGDFHISYRTMIAFAGRHFLDRDATSGYGPETITLNRLDPGTYVYAVHDYTDLASTSGTRLSYSDAVVRAYRESELIAEARITEGKPGTLWRVFKLDGSTGQLTLLDQYGFERDPAKVR
jgi:hypothetical protein